MISASLSRAIGRQLEHPRGPGGWLTGQAMRIANRRPTALAIGALAVQPNDTVLDLGCGAGDAIRPLARLTHTGVIHGLDHSAAMLARAAARNAGLVRDRRVVLQQGAFERLPYRDALFDRVLASNIVYFWRDPKAVMAEILRVLRPGGRLSIYATDGQAMARWSFVRSGTHILYDAAQFERMLAACTPRDGYRVSCVPVGFGIAGLIGTVDKPVSRDGCFIADRTDDRRASRPLGNSAGR